MCTALRMTPAWAWPLNYVPIVDPHVLSVRALSSLWCAWLQEKEVHVFKLFISGAPASVLGPESRLIRVLAGVLHTHDR